MNIKVDFDLDIMSLFVHEGYYCGPIDETWIAQMINSKLDDIIELKDKWQEVELITPDECGLDRFILKAFPYSGNSAVYYSDRAQNEEELKALLPPEIFKAIKVIAEAEFKHPVDTCHE
jgi:hypothetical protein